MLRATVNFEQVMKMIDDALMKSKNERKQQQLLNEADRIITAFMKGQKEFIVEFS